MLDRIKVHEAYCDNCGAIISDKDNITVSKTYLRNKDKHEDFRRKLKLVRYEFDILPIEVDIKALHPSIIPVLERKGKLKNKKSIAKVKIDIDDIIDEVVDELEGKSADYIDDHDKITLKPFKAKRDDRKGIVCEVCGNVIVGVE